MGSDIGLYGYLLGRLPLFLTFLSGYIVYMLLTTTKLTDAFVWWSIRRSRGHFDHLLIYVIGSAALLSFFIPNAVTVLTLLPFVRAIDHDLTEPHGDRRVTTALTLAIIYGANIGGMGSIIGSPANLLLIGALDLYGVAGKDQLSFMNWFFWSIPLVVAFAAAAWTLLICFGVPKNITGQTGRLDNLKRQVNFGPEQKTAVTIFLFFLVFWITEGIVREIFPAFVLYEPVVCSVFFIMFVYLTFLKKHAAIEGPLLKLRDITKRLPKRGMLFLGIVVVMIPLIRLLEVDKSLANLFSYFIRPEASPFLVFFSTTVTVIFLTEILSNTIVATAFFPIVYFAAGNYGMAPLILMLAVSIASTCAFMTPIATPCNALAFGEMRRTSLGKMILIGLPLNIIGAFLITLWLRFVIPLVYTQTMIF